MDDNTWLLSRKYFINILFCDISWTILQERGESRESSGVTAKLCHSLWSWIHFCTQNHNFLQKIIGTYRNSLLEKAGLSVLVMTRQGAINWARYLDLRALFYFIACLVKLLIWYDRPTINLPSTIIHSFNFSYLANKCSYWNNCNS